LTKVYVLFLRLGNVGSKKARTTNLTEIASGN